MINVLSACNPTPLANEAGIYHLYRVADVREKGIQVLETIYFFLLDLTTLTGGENTTKQLCVSPNRKEELFIWYLHLKYCSRPTSPHGFGARWAGVGGTRRGGHNEEPCELCASS